MRITTAIASRTAALAAAARISSRWSPNVRPSERGRAAIRTATSDRIIADESAKTCPASARSASELLARPAATSTARMARLIASAAASRLAWRWA